MPERTGWLDTCASKDLLAETAYVKVIEECQGFKIACLKKISIRNDWLTLGQLIKRYRVFPGNGYSDYLFQL
jgi:glucose-1-phosphate thymidylyltransferase